MNLSCLKYPRVTSAILISASIWLFSPAMTLAGLGVSPALIHVPNILENTEVTKTIFLSRGAPVADNIIKVEIVGDVAAYIEGVEEFTLPRGQQQTPYTFTINTNQLSTDQEYRAIIRFVMANEGTGPGGAAAVQPGVNAEITFTVTGEVLKEFSIKQVIMSSAEEKQSLDFSYFMINTGNVEARPTKIDLIITDQLAPENVYTETIPGEKFPWVEAFSDANIAYFSKAELPAGIYWVDFTFYDGEEIVFTRQQLALQITAIPTLGTQLYLITAAIALGILVIVSLLLYKKNAPSQISAL